MREVTLTFPDNSYDEVMQIIKRFPKATIIQDKIEEVPDWIDELVKERIANLKAGESTDYDLNLILVKKEFRLR